jgi:aerobic-type carbon monoxide dehydrogenase small subunit (CoxS/CutS family)
MPTITLNVNGADRVVNVAADTPLIYVLRNDLRLTATRLGCGMSQCGSCAVLADGKEIRSCTTPVSRTVGRKIHTVEGLPGLWAAKRKTAAGPDTMHPIQAAWIANQTPQCGYCQSGMMIAAADLLERIPKPSVAQIKDALTNAPPSPHLCRCGTYEDIVAAIQKAATMMSV